MSKCKVLFALILFSLIVGCSSGSSIFGKDKGGSGLGNDLINGVEGLEMSFLEGAPPNEVFSGTNFDVLVDVKNLGNLDVDEGHIRLGGLTARMRIQGTNVRSIGDQVLGKIKYPGGESRTYDWNVKVLDSAPVRRDISETLTAQICYKGSVESEVEACIRPRPGSPGIIEDGCVVGSKSVSGGQGGPIAITSMTQQVIRQGEGESNKLIFFIEVQNVGGGDVINFNLNDIDKCQISERDKRNAEIIIEQASLVGGGNLQCSSVKGENDNKIIMFGGKGRITCQTIEEISNEDHYPVDLYMKMNYGYVKSENTRFTLKKDTIFS
jgi:hypothetical protein